MCYTHNSLGIGVFDDGVLQTSSFGQKRLPFRLGRQRRELRCNGRRKLILLGIFRRTRDRAMRDGASVIHRDVVQQSPRGFDIARLGPHCAKRSQSQQHGGHCETR